MTFTPAGNEEIVLGGYVFRVRALAESGPLSRKALRMVGGRAQVYQLIEAGTSVTSGTDTTVATGTMGRPHALKVMLPAFRRIQLLRNQRLLAQLVGVPGFEACDLTYITPSTHPQEVARYSDLIYASLMPWVQGVD